MLKHDALGDVDWLSLSCLSFSLNWNDSPNSVVSLFDMETNFLVTRESGESHWGDWTTTEIEWLIQDV